jgi:hypothetical protein
MGTKDRIELFQKHEYEPPIMSNPGICSPNGPFFRGRLSIREVTRFAKESLILEDMQGGGPLSFP